MESNGDSFSESDDFDAGDVVEDFLGGQLKGKRGT